MNFVRTILISAVLRFIAEVYSVVSSQGRDSLTAGQNTENSYLCNAQSQMGHLYHTSLRDIRGRREWEVRRDLRGSVFWKWQGQYCHKPIALVVDWRSAEDELNTPALRGRGSRGPHPTAPNRGASDSWCLLEREESTFFLLIENNFFI